MAGCNVCGGDRFIDMNTRKNVRCEDCGSLERTRLLWLYLQKITLAENARILHLAPEEGLYRNLVREHGSNYVTADIDPRRYAFAEGCRKLDLCSLDEEPSDEYDLILHSHVLEHVPCNIAYTLFHLHRMLKPDGLHVCIIPFMPGRYDESFQALSTEETVRRFGQFDHVRRFGKDDIPSHLGSVMVIPDRFDATTEFPPEQLRAAHIPEVYWTGFHIGTVLILKKTDMKLLAK